VVNLIVRYGTSKWSLIASHLPGRIGKQCRERCAALACFLSTYSPSFPPAFPFLRNNNRLSVTLL